MCQGRQDEAGSGGIGSGLAGSGEASWVGPVEHRLVRARRGKADRASSGAGGMVRRELVRQTGHVTGGLIRFGE